MNAEGSKVMWHPDPNRKTKMDEFRGIINSSYNLKIGMYYRRQGKCQATSRIHAKLGHGTAPATQRSAVRRPSPLEVDWPRPTCRPALP